MLRDLFKKRLRAFAEDTQGYITVEAVIVLPALLWLFGVGWVYFDAFRQQSVNQKANYVIGDMISPVKAAVGPGYGELEARLAAAIHLRFGLPATLPATVKKQIKRADRISAWLEATQIAGFSQVEANRFFGRPRPEQIEGLRIALRPPVEVRAAYTARHAALIAAL